jgi:rod shape-determining protein MreD
MRSSYLISSIIFIPLIIIQLTVIPLISIQGIIPDLIMILLMFYTLKEGQMYGTVMGFVFGVMFDLISGGVLGSAAFAKTLSGFIGGYFYNENTSQAYLTTYRFALVVLLCSLIDSTLFSFFSGSDFDYSLAVMFLRQGIIPAVYTAVVSNLVLLFVPKKGLS